MGSNRLDRLPDSKLRRRVIEHIASGESAAVVAGSASAAVSGLDRGRWNPEVFARVVEVFAKPPLARCTLVVDYTAVGRTVVEALRRTKVSAVLKPATVTAGLTARPDGRGG